MPKKKRRVEITIKFIATITNPKVNLDELFLGLPYEMEGVEIQDLDGKDVGYVEEYETVDVMPVSD